MINETFGLVQGLSDGMEGSPSTSFLQKNSSPMVAPFSLKWLITRSLTSFTTFCLSISSLCASTPSPYLIPNHVDGMERGFWILIRSIDLSQDLVEIRQHLALITSIW